MTPIHRNIGFANLTPCGDNTTLIQSNKQISNNWNSFRENGTTEHSNINMDNNEMDQLCIHWNKKSLPRSQTLWPFQSSPSWKVHWERDVVHEWGSRGQHCEQATPSPLGGCQGQWLDEWELACSSSTANDNTLQWEVGQELTTGRAIGPLVYSDRGTRYYIESVSLL